MILATDKQKVRTIAFQADAFRMSFSMARITYARLLSTLTSIEPRFVATGTFDDEIASAFADAWSLVDILHRVGDLAEQSRLVSLRQPEAQIFLRKLSPVGELRNHFQHFRSGIHQLPMPAEPLFGSLTWVSSTDSQKCFSILSGTLVEGVSSAGLSYDTWENRYCQRVRLAAGTADVDLEVGVHALEEFAAHLSAYLESKGAKALLEAPLGLATTLEVKREKPNKAPEPTTMAVTPRAPSSTSRASPGRGSS